MRPRVVYRGAAMALSSRVGLVPGVKRLIRADAAERLGWMRDNLGWLMLTTDHDAAAIYALTGVSAGTVRNFLRGTDSSLGNVLLMSLALGVSLSDLERPPSEFKRQLAEQSGG